MAVYGCAALAFFQEDLSGIQHDLHLQMIFTAIAAIVLAIALLMVIVGGIAALAAVKKAKAMADRVEGKIMPLVERTHSLVNELAPKIQNITENVEQISYTVRAKVDEISATVSELNRTVQDANGRTRAQVSRVDAMVSDALTTAQHVSKTVQEGIRWPVQRIAGLVAGLRTGIETLIERSPFGNRGADTPNRYDM